MKSSDFTYEILPQTQRAVVGSSHTFLPASIIVACEIWSGGYVRRFERIVRFFTEVGAPPASRLTCSPFQRPGGDAFDDLALQEQIQHEDGNGHQHDAGEEHAVVAAVLRRDRKIGQAER